MKERHFLAEGDCNVCGRSNGRSGRYKIEWDGGWKLAWCGPVVLGWKGGSLRGSVDRHGRNRTSLNYVVHVKVVIAGCIDVHSIWR